jgi:hypothetical protein
MTKKSPCLTVQRPFFLHSHSAETDLEDIKEAFIDKYEKKLSKMVKVGDRNSFRQHSVSFFAFIRTPLPAKSALNRLTQSCLF